MTIDLIKKSFAAGILIALGCCISMIAENPVIGAFLFSIGLVSVRIFKLYLFTGKTQDIISGDIEWWRLLIILVFNILGAQFIMLLFWIGNHGLMAIRAIAATKMARPWYTLLCCGIGCGALMTLATHKDSPLWLSIMCVMGFILAGFEHSIADGFYLTAIGPVIWVQWQFWTIVAGNFLGGIGMAYFIKQNKTSP